MEREKRLITAALTYVNNIPHVGHIVGCHLPADIFARFSRSYGYDTTFVGGSDMHGTPSLITAKQLGIPVEVLTEELHKIHKKIYEKLNISYDIYSHTNTPVHKKITEDFFLALYKNGYISKGEMQMFYCKKDKMFLPDRFVIGTCPRCGYESAHGDQCENCDSLFGQKELLNPKCMLCGENAILKKSKHLFIRLSKGTQFLDKWVESKKDIWRPHVYAEAKKWIEEGLKDRCISRDISWGFKIPLKGYEDKVFYVWFDAPIGYISITKELSEQKYVDLWIKRDAKIYNFVGKDNIQFHTIFFPVMLIENKQYNLPYNVVGLNFLNFEGQKFSKSKKIGVFCNALLNDDNDIDIDTLRAYLTTIIPETRDTDFRWEKYKDNTNSNLVGKFGNLFNRTLSMIKNYLGGEIDLNVSSYKNLNEFDKSLIKALGDMPKQIRDSYEHVELHDVYKLIMHYATIGNEYIEKSAPWKLIKQKNMREAQKVLSLAFNLCSSLCVVSAPIIPAKVKILWQEQLNLPGDPTSQNFWKNSGILNLGKHKIGNVYPIFEKLDDQKLNDLKEAFSAPFNIKDYFKGKS